MRLRADLAHQRSSVVVTGFDAATRSVINERAGAEVMEAEAASGRTGPRVVQKALGASASLPRQGDGAERGRSQGLG